MGFIQLIFVLIFVAIAFANVIARVVRNQHKGTEEPQEREGDEQKEKMKIQYGQEKMKEDSVDELYLKQSEGQLDGEKQNRDWNQDQLSELQVSDIEQKPRDLDVSEKPFRRNKKRQTVDVQPSDGLSQLGFVAQSDEGRITHREGSGLQRIQSLSFLKRAVVLAEILGRPKGFNG